MAELKQLCEQVETIKAERDVIETEIKDAKCDMSKCSNVVEHFRFKGILTK